MNDKEILKELCDQRMWWESALEKEQRRVDEIKIQLSKVNRLIGLLEDKVLKSPM